MKRFKGFANARILRRRGQCCSVLDLDQVTRDQIGRLGRQAQELLTAQDQSLWTRAAGPDFLPLVVGGAIVMQRLGQQTRAALLLEDAGAHMAFVTCNAMAMMAKSLNQETKSILERMIRLLAMCCPVEIMIASLPPFDSLPEQFRESSVIRRQYQEWEETSGCTRDVMLSDALALLRIFQKANRPGDFATLAHLSEITAGLRTILQRVRETS